MVRFHVPLPNKAPEYISGVLFGLSRCIDLGSIATAVSRRYMQSPNCHSLKVKRQAGAKLYTTCPAKRIAPSADDSILFLMIPITVEGLRSTHLGYRQLRPGRRHRPVEFAEHSWVPAAMRPRRRQRSHLLSELGPETAVFAPWTTELRANW